MFRSTSWRFKKHVDSFKNHPNLSPSTRQVSKGVFDTVFECKGGQVFVVRVDCRAEPMARLFGCVAEHPLIEDAEIRITYNEEKLLGAAIMDAIVEMQVNPPHIMGFTEECVRALQKEPETNPDPPAFTPSSSARQDIPEAVVVAVGSFLQDETITTAESSSSRQTRPVHAIRRSEGSDGQSFDLTFKDQAQTVLESGANTPSLISVLPMVEARAIHPEEEDRRSSREHLSVRSSGSHTTAYTFTTP